MTMPGRNKKGSIWHCTDDKKGKRGKRYRLNLQAERVILKKTAKIAAAHSIRRMEMPERKNDGVSAKKTVATTLF